MKNPLLDMEFLNELHNNRQREVFARVTLLNQNELPIEYIEGRVTAGSVSVDGNSALRRTCNLTLTLKDQSEINQFYWTFQSKFKLEVGLKNIIEPKYPDIIWFPQGIFILTSCNMNQTTNNYTITINGKDKMCKLNGDMGGNIMASTDFGVLEEIDSEGDIIYTKLLLKDIIREMLINQGGELAENIIINDLDEAGLELLEYHCEEKPLYLFREVIAGAVENVTLNEEMKVQIVGQTGLVAISSDAIKYCEMEGLMLNSTNATEIYLLDENEKAITNKTYQIMKYDFGTLAGYRLTDLTYAGELKANVGETIMSVLDKIKNMLGEFEYFYNLDGKFVFQKKRTYISTPWNAVESNGEENFFNEAIKDSYPVINLTDAKLTTTFANNPNLLNLKNDFSVWGTYKSISGADIPIHMRYAIDKKPTSYQPIRPLKTETLLQIKQADGNWKEVESEREVKYHNALNYEGLQSVSEEGGEYVIGDNAYKDKTITHYAIKPYTIEECDWRELIYQMALDQLKCGKDEDFYDKIRTANPWTAPSGRTGYEQYYTDMQGFWRQLYDPNPDSIFEEIDADSLASLNLDNKESIIYVENPYVPLTEEEYLDLVDTNYKLNANSAISIDDVYIVAENIIKDKDGEESIKKTFYPFIGSKKCCLYQNDSGESSTYYYPKGEQIVSSSDKTVLNSIPLKSIYGDRNNGNGPKKLVVEFRLEDAKIRESNRTIQLWKKSSDKIALNKLHDECKKIYKGGQEDNKNYIQYLTNWLIDNNYGEYSNKKESADKITYLKENPNGEYESDYWHKSVKEQPEQLLFWFDFLDAEGSELFDKYSVRAIGDRTKSINDSNVKSIYYRDVPNVIFVQSLADNKYERKPGYTYISIPAIYQSLFSISGRGKSAKERIDELLQEHSYCVEATTITSVPLYHLEPNTRIFVDDDKTNVHGEYMINKVTVPFAYNGTMSLSSNKIVSNIV